MKEAFYVTRPDGFVGVEVNCNEQLTAVEARGFARQLLALANKALAEDERRWARKEIRVEWDNETDADYRWFIGNRRVWPDGKKGIGALDSGTLERFFKRHRITHVVSKFGDSETSDECIKDGTHTVKSYLKWWRRLEKEG